MRTDGPRDDARPNFYLPMRQAPPAAWGWVQRTMTVVVRGSDVDAEALTGAIREAVRASDPALPVHSVATMPQRLRTTLAQDRFNTAMGLLSAIGLVLSAVGIYGVISCFVAQRRRELAIRSALGAGGRTLVLMVLQQGMRPVWVGVIAGLAVSAAASRMLETYVYGITTRDPLTFVSVVVLLVAAAILANVMPARAAARVDPAELLVN